MNEIFKRLSLQAGGSHYPGINPQLQQKFAESIVQECIGVLEMRKDHPVVVNAIREIQEHFGIEK